MTTTTRDAWSGRNVERARAYVAANLMPGICAHCQQPVTPDQAWIVGHTIPRWERPDLTLDPSNWRPEHKPCSDASGPAEQARIRAAARAAVDAGLAGTPVFPDSDDAGSPAPSRLSPRQAQEAQSGAEPALSRPEDFASVPWLADLLPVPENASWPRHMTPVHPDAVGSYGPQYEAWAVKVLGSELRWWHRLAVRRQLEHDADGRLVWPVVVESGPRRIGKSYRLRGGALWRLQHGRELFGEPQLVLHTGRDLAIVREIQRAAWPYAELAWGARAVTRANGKEAVETDTGDRWLARAVGAVYGYDVCLGMVDEGWDVEAGVVDEGLEPATMERKSPQVVLTSTAHRRATVLMPRRIDAALAGMGEDWSTLLLLWCAGPNDDPGDVEAWRRASPHWSEEREKLIRAKYERAMRGEADPSAEDPDPMAGFLAQYLNRWPAQTVRSRDGDEVVTAAEWGALAKPVDGSLVAVAVENWFEGGVSVVAARLVAGGRVHLSGATFGGLPEAAAYVDELRPPAILAGKSLARDHLLSGAEAMVGSGREAMLALRRMLDDGALVHDGSPVLAQQVLGLRSSTGPDGPRLVSRSRTDAVKAAVWAAQRAREYGETPRVY